MRVHVWKLVGAFAAIATPAILVSGCVAFGAHLVAKDLGGTTAEIRGINRATQGTATQTRMLVVHGMGGDRCPGYTVSKHRFSSVKRETPGMLSRMSEALGVCLLRDPRDDEKDHCIEEDATSYPALKLTKFEYARAVPGRECAGDTALRVYELYYTGAAEKIEQDINAYNRRVLGRSVWVNRLIKRDLMVSGFGDAVMYLGDYGETIRAAVRGTLCQMATDPLQGAAQLEPVCPAGKYEFVKSDVFILAHSLGSNIVIDTLTEVTEPDKHPIRTKAVDQVTGQVKGAYLMANQDALLEMINAGPGPFRDEHKMARLLAKFANNAELVAFSDRNDALSYALASGACPGNARCINAALNVVRWGLPFVFADPIKAHTGYADDKTVIECISKGCG